MYCGHSVLKFCWPCEKYIDLSVLCNEKEIFN
jgi:hypothetical protein